MGNNNRGRAFESIIYNRDKSVRCSEPFYAGNASRARIHKH